MNKLALFNKSVTNKKLPGIKPGDVVEIHEKIKEKDKERIQIFEGLVIAIKHGSEAGATITVRKESKGIGVERIFPLYLPTLEKFEIIKKSKVRRAKLYYIRKKTAKMIRKKLKSELLKKPKETTEEKN